MNRFIFILILIVLYIAMYEGINLLTNFKLISNHCRLIGSMVQEFR